MSIFNLGAGGGAPTLEARTVTPSTSQQIIKPSRDEYDGLSQVTVEATPLETKTVNPSTSSQTITPSGSNIGFSTVTVNPYRLQSKNVTPSTVPYTVSPDSGYNGLSGVTFGRDTNLTAGNIVKGKTIYGVSGTAQYPMLVDKTVENYPLSTSIIVPLPSTVKNLTYITAFVISCAAGNTYAFRSDIFASFYSIIPVSGYTNKIIGHPALDNTIKSGGIGGVGATSINPANIENIDIYINSNSSNITISNIRLGTGQTGGQTLYIGGDYVNVSLIGYSGEAIPYTT